MAGVSADSFPFQIKSDVDHAVYLKDGIERKALKLEPIRLIMKDVFDEKMITLLSVHKHVTEAQKKEDRI